MTTWITVNLPWSPTSTFVPPPEPNTDAEERTLFDGKTFAELEEDLEKGWTIPLGEALKRESGFLYHHLKKETQERLAAIRRPINERLLRAREARDRLPILAKHRAAVLEASRVFERSFFSSQATPGMLVETASNLRYLIGDLDAFGGLTDVGARGVDFDLPYFRNPLEGETIVRYCMVDLPT